MAKQATPFVGTFADEFPAALDPVFLSMLGLHWSETAAACILLVSHLEAAVTAGLPIFVIAEHGTGLRRGDADETEHRFIALSTSIRRLFPIARRTAAAWADSRAHSRSSF